MKRVVVVGSAIVDVMVKSSSFKVMKSHQVKGGVALCEVYGGKTDVEEVLMVVGGAGTNVAVALSRLGMIVSSLVRVGEDAFGNMIKADLVSESVDISLIQVDSKGRTGLSVILVASDGGRSIMTYRGVSKEIEGEEVDWEKMSKANWIQISSMGGNLSLIEDVVSFATKQGVRVGINPGKGEFTDLERLARVISKVDLVVVNKLEAEMILRRGEEDKVELARSLAKIGARMSVVTEGKKGAVIAGEDRLIEMESFKVKSEDDTGAGDAFCAGLVAGLVEDKGMAEALKMGVANGASEVTKLGVKTGLLDKRGMEKWARKSLKTIEVDN